MHQNGELLSKTVRPFNKRGRIVLTSNPDGELSAPFYPLPTDIRILKITARGVEVDLDPNWEGFTTCEGKIEDINSNRKSAYTHIMKKGDYGSIAYNDLRILIRIGKDRQTNLQKAKQNPEYRGSAIDLWLGPARELKFLALGGFASAWLIGGFALGLLKHPDMRPQSFIELRNEYTLPFIHPTHLLNAPESLQSHYNRQAPLQSALGFSEAFTDTVLGYTAHEKNYLSPGSIFKSAQDRYADLYLQHRADLEVLAQKRSQIESKVLTDQRNALIALPLIKGETFGGSLLRLEDKLKLWYENAQMSLEKRRLISDAFRDDALYNYTEYKDPNKVKKDKIEVGVNPKDEAALYKEAASLADAAEQHRAQIMAHREPLIGLDKNNSSPLALDAANLFTSTATPLNFSAFNQKLGLIQATLFNPDKPKIIREPLIGTLDPKLIQQTIDRYRFELQLCYELALRRNQEAKGAMEWQWHLDTQGQIFDIELLQSNINDAKMVECIRGKIASWKWPRPQKGSIQISFPFHFKPAKG